MHRFIQYCFLIIIFYTNCNLSAQTLPQNDNRIDDNGLRQGSWTILYDTAWQIVKDPKKAQYYRQISYKDDMPFGTVSDHFNNGTIQWKGILLTDKPEEQIDGKCFFYRIDGTLEYEAFFDRGELVGQLEYDEQGNHKVESWEEIYWFGNNFWNRNENSEALKYYSLGRKLAELNKADTSLQYANVVNDIALCLLNQENYFEAIKNYQISLKLKEGLVGIESDIYFTTAKNLGIALFTYGNTFYNDSNYNAAIENYMQSKSILEKVDYDKSMLYSNLMSQIGLSYKSLKMYDTAKFYINMDLAIKENLIDFDEQKYNNSLFNLASTIYDEGDLYWERSIYDSAKLLFQQALPLSIPAYGKYNWLYADLTNDIGLCLENLNSPDSSEFYYRESLLVKDSLYGKISSKYASTENNLALLYRNNNRTFEAIPLYKNVLKTYKEILDESDKRLWLAHKNLAGAYFNVARYSDAEIENRVALDLAEKYQDKNSMNYAFSLNNLSISLEKLGRYEESLKLLLNSRKIIVKLKREKSLSFAQNTQNLAIVHLSLNNYKEAEFFYKETLRLYLELEGKISNHYNEANVNLLRFYLVTGKVQETEQLCREIESFFISKEDFKSNYYGSFCLDHGIVMMNGGNYIKAEELILESLSIIKQLRGKEHPDYINALDVLAELYSKQAKFKESEALYIQNLENSIEKYGNESPNILTRYSNLADFYLDTGNYPKADSLLKHAKDITIKLFGREGDNYVAIISIQAILSDYLGDLNAAEKYYLETLRIEENIYGNESNQIAGSYTNIGAFYLDAGNLAKAEEYLKKSILLREKLFEMEHPDFIHPYRYLGILYRRLGDNAKAEQYFNISLKMADKLFGTNHPDYGFTLLDLAMLYDDQNRLVDAEKAQKKVVDIYTKNFGEENPKTISSIEFSGTIALSQKNYALAAYYYSKSANLSEKLKLKNSLGYGNSLNNIAFVLERQGLYEESLSYYQKSAVARTKSGNLDYDPNLGGLQINMAITKEKLGLVESAATNYNNTIEIVDKQIKNNFISLSEKEKMRYYNTVNYFFREQADFAYRNRNTIPELSIQLMETQLLSKGLLFRSSNQMRQSILYSGDKELVNLYYSWKDKKEILANLYQKGEFDQKLKIKQLEDETNNMEKVLSKKSQLFNQIRNNTNSNWVDIRKKLKKSEAAVEIFRFVREEHEKVFDYIGKGISFNTLPDHHPRVSYTYTDSPAGRSEIKPNDEILEIDGKKTWLKTEDELYEMIDGCTSCKLVFRSGKDSTLTESMLTNDSVFIDKTTYIPTYAVLIIKPDTREYPEMIFLENGDELEDKYIKYYRSAIKFKLTDGSSYSQFWMPISEHLDGINKVYISLDGVYHNISLNTLFNTVENRYLDDELDIRLVGNLSDVLIPKNKSKIYEGTLIGYPDYNNDIESLINKSKERTLAMAMEQPLDTTQRFFNGKEIAMLPGTLKEVNTLTQIFNDAHIPVRSYMEAEATEPLIKELISPGVLHIATHGFFLKSIETDQNEDGRGIMGMDRETLSNNTLFRSGLLFSNAKNALKNGGDGVLTAYEAMNLNLNNTEVVVLSACETGLGEIKNGEGVYGLQRAIQSAGAKTVLMSLWTVSDEATQLLMTNFYTNWLLNKEDKHTALKNARMSLRNQYPDPFFWGAFVMVGE